MSFEIPAELRFKETHEWTTTDDTARIGISDFAQDELGDIVFVELPDIGDTIEQDEEFGVVESIKAVSDVYAPISGEVTAVNDAVFDQPELLNEDPYGDGWLLEVAVSDDSEFENLLDADEYEAQIA